MLGSLRDAAGSWLAKGLLSILVLSFAVWGISGRIAGVAGHESVVTVGGTSVSVNEYRLAYDRQVNALSQQYGQRITQEQAKGLGIARFQLKYSAGPLAHERLMACIRLYGEQVIPLVREMLA